MHSGGPFGLAGAAAVCASALRAPAAMANADVIRGARRLHRGQDLDDRAARSVTNASNVMAQRGQ
jgi:hypothetical protein